MFAEYVWRPVAGGMFMLVPVSQLIHLKEKKEEPHVEQAVHLYGTMATSIGATVMTASTV